MRVPSYVFTVTVTFEKTLPSFICILVFNKSKSDFVTAGECEKNTVRRGQKYTNNERE